MGNLFKYAWRGAHQSRNEIYTSMLGGVLIWTVSYLEGWQMTFPAWIANNVWLSNIILLFLCVIAAQSAVFLMRLAYWPIHRRVAPQGGFWASLRARLGEKMLPVVLMTTGICAFVTLFGAGAVLFAIDIARYSNTAIAQQPARSEYDVNRRLQGLDELFKIVSVDMQILDVPGQELYNNLKFSIKDGSYKSKLDDYILKSRVATEKFNQIIRSYGIMPDLFDTVVKTTFDGACNPMSIYSTSLNLKYTIDKAIGKNGSNDVWDDIETSQFMAEWKRSIQPLGTWVNEIELILTVKRQKILDGGH